MIDFTRNTAGRLLFVGLTAATTALAVNERPAAHPPSGSDIVGRFEQRLSRCPPGDVQGRFRLAQWADDRDMHYEAERLYRQVLNADPLHEEAYARLVELAASRALPRDSEAYDAARASLPAHFVTYETPHYVVFSDADAQWTSTQAQQLERTLLQFERYTRRMDLRPLPLEHKLVCVIFAERHDYQTFCHDEDSVEDPWIAGYYSPQHDRMVFYRAETNPSVVEARRKLDEMRRDIDEIAREVDLARRRGDRDHVENLMQYRDRYREHYDHERDRVETFTERVNVSTTTHEAAHQLLYHTRIQAPYKQYPLWLSEGLATAFETASAYNAFGPDYEYAPRQEVFIELLHDDALLPLGELVTWERLATGNEETVRAAYHQSYALIQWMSRYRRGELRAYLESMLVDGPLDPTPEEHLELFETAFGSVDRLERQWLRHERSRAQR